MGPQDSTRASRWFSIILIASTFAAFAGAGACDRSPSFDGGVFLATDATAAGSSMDAGHSDRGIDAGVGETTPRPDASSLIDSSLSLSDASPDGGVAREAEDSPAATDAAGTDADDSASDTTGPPTCDPSCGGVRCGSSDGCGGTCTISCICVPSCAGTLCGEGDGCGGSCSGLDCICVPDCGPLDCGTSDGCGGSCNGGCACVPSCAGASCGETDGCGGTCDGSDCTCIPDCGSSDCGTSDGCGGTCADGCDTSSGDQ